MSIEAEYAQEVFAAKTVRHPHGFATYQVFGGDTLTFQAQQSNGSSIAIFSVSSYNSISIERVGN